MQYLLPNGRTVPDSRGFVLDGRTYTKGWLRGASQSELDALGITEYTPSPRVVTPRPRYASLESALVAMNQWIEDLGPQLRGHVPTDERLSWDAKLAEANAYLADNTVSTPILTEETQITGETVADLAQTVVDKGAEYSVYAGQIAGLRRATETALKAVTDPLDYETVLANAQTQAETLMPS